MVKHLFDTITVITVHVVFTDRVLVLISLVMESAGSCFEIIQSWL